MYKGLDDAPPQGLFYKSCNIQNLRRFSYTRANAQACLHLRHLTSRGTHRSWDRQLKCQGQGWGAREGRKPEHADIIGQLYRSCNILDWSRSSLRPDHGIFRTITILESLVMRGQKAWVPASMAAPNPRLPRRAHRVVKVLFYSKDSSSTSKF